MNEHEQPVRRMGIRAWTTDALVVILLMSLGGTISWWASGKMRIEYTEARNFDAWFDADIPSVYDNLTSRYSDYRRTGRHPLFLSFGFPARFLIRKAFGLSQYDAARGLMALFAGALPALVYSIARSLRLSAFEAGACASLVLTSAFFIFFSGVVETFVFGSLTMLAALLIIARRETIRHLEVACIAVGVLEFGVTVTNWMAGGLASFACLRWRRAIQVLANTFCIAVLIWGVQSRVFPHADRFIFSSDRGAAVFVNSRDASSLIENSRSFLLSSIVAPEAKIIDLTMAFGDVPLKERASMDGADAWTGLALAGVVLWTLLLVIGVYALMRTPGQGVFRVALALLVVGQYGLHLVFGEETFLYTAHFGPLLILVAAFGMRTRHPRFVAILTYSLAALLALNNSRAFLDAVEKTNAILLVDQDHATIDAISGNSFSAPKPHRIMNIRHVGCASREQVGVARGNRSKAALNNNLTNLAMTASRQTITRHRKPLLSTGKPKSLGKGLENRFSKRCSKMLRCFASKRLREPF